jgi:hypothetical protein
VSPLLFRIGDRGVNARGVSGESEDQTGLRAIAQHRPRRCFDVLGKIGSPQDLAFGVGIDGRDPPRLLAGRENPAPARQPEDQWRRGEVRVGA